MGKVSSFRADEAVSSVAPAASVAKLFAQPHPFQKEPQVADATARLPEVAPTPAPTAVLAGDVAVCPRSKERLRAKLYTGLVLIDAAGVFLGFTLANFLRFGDAAAAPGLSWLSIILPSYLALAFANGVYGLDALEQPRRAMLKALRTLGVAAVVVLVALFLAKYTPPLSRVALVGGLAASAVILGVGRSVFGRIARDVAHGSFLNELLLAEAPPRQAPRGGFVPVGPETDLSPSANDPVTSERLGLLLHGYERVLVAAPEEDRVKWREALKGTGVDVEILTPELDALGGTTLRRSDYGTSIRVSASPLRPHERVIKRLFDLVAGGLITLFALPVLGLAALAVGMTSKGPILFRQARIGQANCQFELLKFRTMYADRCDCEGACSATRDDERTTPVGRFLRRTSLDELPQLFNVLRGEMSLVGPRPHAVGSLAADSPFWQVDPRYWHRAAVKPGITGLAQVRGFRGPTVTEDDLRQRLESDLEYLGHWSLWRDLEILARTARVMVHPNAY